MVACVDSSSGVNPAAPRKADSAIVKQPAWAAAINSSGFVPMPFSKRAENEYCVCFNTPLCVERVPLPCLRSPFHTADAVRFIGFWGCLAGGKELQGNSERGPPLSM